MAVAAEEFRAGMARWASGVTIVTARAGERLHGMTVSAFCSVSLDPPLVLICADNSSHTLEVIDAAGAFAVHVLAREQQPLSDRFASKRDEWRRFEGLALDDAATGSPLIPGALVAFDCRVTAAHPAGDHVIYVAEVQQIATREGEPLLFYRGGYRGFDTSGEDG